MDRIAEKEMERMFFPVARSAHEWNWMGVMTFLGLIHDDCVRVCDGEAMVGVMCVGPLVVVVVISVGIQKKETYNFSRVSCKTGNFQVVVFFYRLEGINDQQRTSMFTACDERSSLIVIHLAGSDRLGPRVEEVWVWKLKMRKDDGRWSWEPGSNWKSTSNYWIYGFYMMFIGLYMFFFQFKTNMKWYAKPAFAAGDEDLLKANRFKTNWTWLRYHFSHISAGNSKSIDYYRLL